MSAALDSAVARLEAVADRLEKINLQGGTTAAAPTAIAKTTTPPPSAPTTATGSALQAYQDLLTTKLPPVLSAAQALGGEALIATQLLVDGYTGETDIIEAIANCTKPTDTAQLQTLLQPVGSKMMAVGDLRAAPKSPFVQHLKFLSEAVQALSWVAYTGPGCGMELPSKHVENTWGAAEFYGNKILMEYKSKGDDGVQHVKWVTAVKELTLGLKDDVCRKFFTTGPEWNAQGIPLNQFKPSGGKPSGGATSAAKSEGTSGVVKKKAGPPPPPPPPPGGLAALVAAKQGNGTGTSTTTSSKTGGGGGGNPMAALFAEINKGEGITSGLKKVTADMKTKNRTDRSGAVPAPSTTSGTTTAGTTATTGGGGNNKVTGGTPRIECEQGRKWAIEHQSNNREIIITDTTPKQSVYVYGCHNSTIQVQGKVNAITLDGCTRCGLVFESIVSSCEIVNCKNMEVQCIGSVPTLAVDKTDGCQLYLPRECLALTDITTAKTSAVNVILPGEGGGDGEESDPVESAIPEQFVTKWCGGRFVTEAVSHSGG